MIGFRKHVMETREPLMIEETSPEAAERYGNPLVLSGEPVKSALFVPLVVGGRAPASSRSRTSTATHAFGEDDQRLLTTLAGSLSVALDNARLVHETRQRVAELATVNSVGQALASQLELDALIELVGERVRETFEADIAYVALHDEAAGRIDFAYYYETGERRPEPPLQYGEGLTSQILESREPLAAQPSGAVRRARARRHAVTVVPRRADPRRRQGDRRDQRPEHRGGGPLRRGRRRACSRRSPPTSASRSRPRACSPRSSRQKQHFESLVEISPVAVVVMDDEERVTGWNPAAAELFGYSAEEAIGRPIDDLVFGEDGRGEGREITEEALAVGHAQRIARAGGRTARGSTSS